MKIRLQNIQWNHSVESAKDCVFINGRPFSQFPQPSDEIFEVIDNALEHVFDYAKLEGDTSTRNLIRLLLKEPLSLDELVHAIMYLSYQMIKHSEELRHDLIQALKSTPADTFSKWAEEQMHRMYNFESSSRTSLRKLDVDLNEYINAVGLLTFFNAGHLSSYLEEHSSSLEKEMHESKNPVNSLLKQMMSMLEEMAKETNPKPQITKQKDLRRDFDLN